MSAIKGIKVLTAVLIAISFVSCQKFLENEPLTENSLETFYRDGKQVKAALAGVYDRLARSETYGDQMQGRMGLEGDDSYYRATASEGVAVNLSYGSDPNVAKNWRFWYDGINRANLLLENLNKAEMDSTERTVVKGEALFLRGYYHFMLVKLWGDVPLMTKSIDNALEVYAERTPAVQVYQQIEKDMIEAEGLVRTAQEVGYGGRVSKSAVRGILARVYLHWAGFPIKDVTKYQDARDWAYKVMKPDPKDGFQHALNPSYEDVFIKHCTNQYDIKESIWEVEFYGNGTTDNGYSETGRIGSNNGILFSGDDPNGKYIYSYAYVLTNARTWYTFENPDDVISKDERRDWSISNYTTANVTGYPGVVETAIPITTKLGRASGKWRRELEVVLPKFKNAGSINFPLLRYSDVLLMFAEAENQIHSGPTSDAIAAVNEVRRRAYGKDLAAESIRFVSISNPGANYTAAPTVTVSGGGGSGAELQAFVHPTTFKLTHIKVLKPGSGYTSVPTITISGGGGTSGAGVAVLSQRRTSTYMLDQNIYGGYEKFQEYIEQERTRELCFEGLRKGDLVRWGKYLDYMERAKNDLIFGDATLGIAATSLTSNAVKYFQNVSQKDLLWPIPTYEMALNKGLKTQNYGY
ncbi:RagB/SusD family nutrient uptake outer membrane protein [Pedobacter arcticus]|uniref:RagB/SusD family nutrient uptake outer membrane protein n=1 Tax=Pedobacter arcticus TaxID=752140 RepID=UPI00030AD27F|nr:RagB/SusD family nutrient uptake outer membrane protein [Pedobacter arcticus]